MKSLLLLTRSVLEEMGTDLCTDTTQDWKTILRRVENEGDEFLSITLPSFGKDFQKSLDVGMVAPNTFKAFARRKGLPVFLRGFLVLVFDTGSGRLLDNPSIKAIRYIRQFCLMFEKIESESSDTRTLAAMRSFVKCEQEIRTSDKSTSERMYRDFQVMSEKLWGSIFREVDRVVFEMDTIPKHGPGATADRLRGNSKYRQTEWTSRLEEVFPSGRFLYPNWTASRDTSNPPVRLLEPGAERPVRVISVPKTRKTPRIIAIEPTCMQYVQQSLLREFVFRIERDGHPASSFVGFRDQVPNQVLAKEGSISGSLATLDLSEASDRVSNQLVRTMLANTPLLAEAVDACRSRTADVRGHGEIRLAKFASMGSALTFPMEAMVFTTIIFLGIQKVLKRQMTLADFNQLRGQVRVYGDDIIVPVDYVQAVHDELEAYGFLVNTGKSFWTGRFRESCGRDYYGGHDVTVVRLRRDIPAALRDVEEIVSLVSFRNQLYQLGYLTTCEMLDTWIRKLIPFPNVSKTSPVLGAHSESGFDTGKMCDNLHRPLVKGYVVKSKLPSDILDGYAALHKIFLHQGREPLQAGHLLRSGRPDAVKIKLGWYSPL